MPSQHLFTGGRTYRERARTLERMESEQPLNPFDGDQLVAALANGDQSAMASLYETYSDRIYSYCVSVCKNPELAADATQDTFLLAFARVNQLRDTSKLRPWLYAIARNECLRQIRSNKREADLDSAPEVADMNATLDTGLNAEDARGLIDAAFEGMNQADREALDLALRQDLDNASIAQVLGVSDNNAAAKVSRAKAQLEVAVGALLLFRTRKSGCPELKSAVGRDDAFNPLTRKRIARHAQTCPTCTTSKSKAVAAIAMAGLPLLAAPAALKGMLFNSAVPGTSTEMASGLADANPTGTYPVEGVQSSTVTNPGSQANPTDSQPNSISDADLPQSQQDTVPETHQGPSETGETQAQFSPDPNKTEVSYNTNKPPQYIANQAPKLPPLDLASQAAQLDKKRPPFDSQGWPRKDDGKTKKWPFVLGGAAMIALLIAGTGSVLAGGVDEPEAAPQTSQPSLQVPTTEAPANGPIPTSTSSKKPQPEPSGSKTTAPAPAPTKSSSPTSSAPTKRPTRSPSSTPTTTAPTPGAGPTSTAPPRRPRPSFSLPIGAPSSSSPIPQ